MRAGWITLWLLSGAASRLAAQPLDVEGMATALAAFRSGRVVLAHYQNVMGWLGGQAMKLTVLGLVLGVAAAAALTRVLGRALFEVSPLDPITYVWVTVALGATALLAA